MDEISDAHESLQWMDQVASEKMEAAALISRMTSTLEFSSTSSWKRLSSNNAPQMQLGVEVVDKIMRHGGLETTVSENKIHFLISSLENMRC
jgi:hypothetical protein